MDIRSPRSLTKTLTHFSIAKWTDESDEDLVEIDLTDVEFIDTAGLVLLSSIAERAMHDRTLVRFTPPADPNVARYASRMHLGTCLAQLGVDAHLPAVNEFDTGARLAELRQVTPATTDELADYVHAAILDNGGSASDAKDFYLAVSEVLSNVVDHSGADGGWAAMQVMPQPGPTPPQITFAVADVGMGLRRSLLKTHTVDDDLVALDLAFQEGVSGTGDTRGMGLSDLYGRVNRRSGIVRVWSGLASGASRRNAAIKCQSLTVGFPGTMIYAALKPQSDKKVIR